MKKFVDSLVATFPEQKINRSAAMTKMFDCTMYLADFPENLGSANYFYKNQSIYFRRETDLTKLDDYMMHELIHYFQDMRDKNGRLDQMGLCYFLEFKIYGMAMNEAAVQYIASRMLKHKEEQITYCGVQVKTISPDYYPLLCNLIIQMVYLVGEDALADSTLFSTDRFLFAFMDIAGEGITKEIQTGFDQLLEAKQQLFGIQTNEERKMQEYQIQTCYEKLQNQILTAYFDGMLSLIETIEEAEEYRGKLEGYIDVMGNTDGFAFYEEYKQKQLEKLNKKIIAISRRNSRNMLAVISSNKIFTLFRLIRNFFKTRKEEYR